MSRVSETIGTGELHPSTGRTDDEHVAYVAARRRGQPEIGEELQASRADHIAARLVARERRFVDQCHPYPAPSQYQGSDAAGWAAPDNENVKARQTHPAPFSCSDLQ